MKKILLSALALTSVTLNISAQTAGKTVNSKMSVGEIYAPIAGKTAIVGCDTLTNIANTSLSYYTVATSTVSGCTTNGGYVTGNNCFGDKEKAGYFSSASYSALSTPQVSGVIVYFYKSGTKGTGGAPTSTVGLNIYSVASSSVIPTTSAGSTTLPMSSLLAAFVGTNTYGPATFTFATPVNVSTTGGFYASVVMPNQTAADTAVIYQNTSSSSFGNNSVEKGSDDQWYSMASSWNLNVRMWIFPIMNCSSISTGIKAEELEKMFNVVPNPSNGVFTLVASLNGLSYDVTVTNAIGQQVLAKKNLSGGSSEELNLTDLNSGIYFVNIRTEQGQTITKKLMLNK